jgi:hypothetical protein
MKARPPSRRFRLLSRLFILAMVGFLLSLASAWILPDFGLRSFYMSVPHSPLLTQPGGITVHQAWSLTSTKFHHVFAYDGATRSPPSLPADARASLEEDKGRQFVRTVNIKGHAVPSYYPPEKAVWSADLRGFPFRCFWSWHADSAILNPDNRPLTNALELPGLGIGPNGVVRSIPVAPLWTGIILNTAFWASFSAVAPSLVVRLRAKIRSLIEQSRLGRGLCPSCLYPIDPETARCPECGRERFHQSPTRQRG